MKKLAVILAVILCLTGCSHSKKPAGRPWSLEVEYGQSSIFAMTGGYEWNWKKGAKTETAFVEFADPRTREQKLSYLNMGIEEVMTLNFAEVPDTLTVEYYAEASGYAEAVSVAVEDMALPLPAEEGAYLYFVTAGWEQEKGSDGWGECTYCFRLLPEGEGMAVSTINYDTGDLELAQVLQMDATDFMGIEFTNYIEGNTKTCRNQQDKAAILSFLHSSLNTDFNPVPMGVVDTEYTLRLVTVTGSQLTIAYADNGPNAYVMAGESVYEAQTMDFEGLWAQMNAGSVSAAAAASGKNYLDMSETYPLEGLQSEPVLAYVSAIENGTVTYDEMRRFEDGDAPEGYRLERGWSDLEKAVSEDCQYWILDEDGSYGKVTANTLLRHSADTANGVLYCIYTENDAVFAICQQPSN